jgi:hypothetical protein
MIKFYNFAIADFVKNIKGSSAHYLNTNFKIGLKG